MLYKRTSTSFRLTLVLISIMIVLGMIIGLLNVRVSTILRQDIAQHYHQLFAMYRDQIDDELYRASSFSWNLAAENFDYQIISIDETRDEELKLEQYRLHGDITEGLNAGSSISQSTLVYSSGKHVLSVTNNNSRYVNPVSREIREALISFAVTYVKCAGQSGCQALIWNWQLIQVAGEPFLLHIFPNGDLYNFSFILMDNLLKPYVALDMGSDSLMGIASMDGRWLSVSSEEARAFEPVLSADFNLQKGENRQQYIVIGEAAGAAPLSLFIIIPDQVAFNLLDRFRQILLAFTLVIALFIPFFSYLIRRLVWHPVLHMSRAMEQVEEGDLTVRITEYTGGREFQVLYTAFNDMLDQLASLRIQVYEEQLKRERAEKDYLLLQVDPHYILNALNLMYSLTRTGKNDVLEEFILLVSRYVRYNFRSDAELVPLQEEMSHIDNYMRIQLLRMPDSVDFRKSDYADCRMFPVPPLSIFTFVENAVKHALDPLSTLELTVDIRVSGESGHRILEVVITDNGPGISQQVLERIRSGEKIVDELREHIGVSNLRQRLDLIYRGQAELELDNVLPHGTSVCLRLPETIPDEQLTDGVEH